MARFLLYEAVLFKTTPPFTHSNSLNFSLFSWLLYWCQDALYTSHSSRYSSKCRCVPIIAGYSYIPLIHERPRYFLPYSRVKAREEIGNEKISFGVICSRQYLAHRFVKHLYFDVSYKGEISGNGSQEGGNSNTISERYQVLPTAQTRKQKIPQKWTTKWCCSLLTRRIKLTADIHSIMIINKCAFLRNAHWRKQGKATAYNLVVCQNCTLAKCQLHCEVSQDIWHQTSGWPQLMNQATSPASLPSSSLPNRFLKCTFPLRKTLAFAISRTLNLN